MSLPTNIDTTYPDRNAGDQVHQQHHDTIHGEVNKLLDGSFPATHIAVNDSAFAAVEGTDVQAALASVDTALGGIGGGPPTASEVTVDNSSWTVLSGANVQAALTSANTALLARIAAASGIVIVDSASPVTRPSAKIVLWLNNSANAVAGDWRIAP